MQVHVGPGALISPQTGRFFSLIRGENSNTGQGRYSDFRIDLLIAPSRILRIQWYSRFLSPVTAAGPSRIRTGFPLSVFNKTP